ncbi:glycosyltransferase family 2 protein [Luteimonas sp. e5]
MVSPIYGCRGCLEDLVDSISKHVGSITPAFEIILVDDASPDAAWPRILELSQTHPVVRGLRLARNFGQHSAISAGIEATRGRWVVVMDCDLQDPPNAIPALFEHVTAQNLDVVFARRMNRKDSGPKRLSSWAFFKVLSWMTGAPQDPSTANFGIFHRRVIDTINRMPERDRSFPLMVKWAGFKHGTLDVEHAARGEGNSSYTLRKLLRLATGIILGYSEKPLKLVAYAGLACASASFLMVAYAIVSWFEGNTSVLGYTSLMASIWLIGGLLLFSLGVVGLYVGQVFRNVQGRPYYVIAEDTRDGK